MRLFRYFSAGAGLATLATKTMRFASPVVFNDPFELTPRIERASDELLMDRLKAAHLVEDYFQNVGCKKGLTPEESSKEYFACEVPRRFKNYQTPEGWEEKSLALKWEFVGLIAKRFRILCCSHREDSILMWSHYAEQHRGMVIEFDLAQMIPGVDLSGEAYDVHYRSSPPSVPALHADMDSFEEALIRVLTTKALEWSYEEEVRIRFPVPKDLNNDEPHDQSFDPQCIKRVIVGCYNQPDAQTYSSVEELAQRPEYKHVRFQRAYLDAHDYRLRFADRPRS